MIPYTQFAASQEVPPPYYFPGVTVNAFLWEAPMGPIQEYCNKFFNLGSKRERGFDYRPASFWPYVLLLFIEYPKMISSADHENIGGETPYPDRGSIKQTEVFVAAPVMRYGVTPIGLLFDTTVEWALPFIVVGNAMSASCGREIQGLGKLLADIDAVEGSYPDSFHGSVRLPGWRDADKAQEQLTFVEVNTAPPLPTSYGARPEASVWSLLQSREANWMMDGLARINGMVGWLTGGMAPTVMRTVSLRQFRDAEEPGKAVYQALESFRCKFSNVSRLRFYNEEDVGIQFYNTKTFADILKVFLPVEPPIWSRKFHPKAAFRFNADIDLDEMRTLHTFPVENAAAPIATRSNLLAPQFRPLRRLLDPLKP
jgi:hypothetical protein